MKTLFLIIFILLMNLSYSQILVKDTIIPTTNLNLKYKPNNIGSSMIAIGAVTTTLFCILSIENHKLSNVAFIAGGGVSIIGGVINIRKKKNGRI